MNRRNFDALARPTVDNAHVPHTYPSLFLPLSDPSGREHKKLTAFSVGKSKLTSSVGGAAINAFDLLALG